MELLNWRILKHPLNWVTVFLMLFIFGLAMHYVLTWSGAKAAPQAEQTKTA